MDGKLAALLLAVASACGPSAIAPPSSESSSDASTDEPATTGAPGETEDSSEDATETFVPKSDQPTRPSCDPFMQDCREGEKCVPYTNGNNWDANKCVPVTGDQSPGEPCIYDGVREGTDDCDATSMCWNVEEVDDALVGECAPFCVGSADQPECPEGSYCPISGAGTITVCIPTCDPVVQDCDEDLACYWIGEEFACVFTTQDIPIGEPCGFVNDCAAGLMCASSESLPACDGASCCVAFCELELGDAQCEAVLGTSCVSFFEAGQAPPEYEHVGICILP
jgi:hypothetical protein